MITLTVPSGEYQTESYMDAIDLIRKETNATRVRRVAGLEFNRELFATDDGATVAEIKTRSYPPMTSYFKYE